MAYLQKTLKDMGPNTFLDFKYVAHGTLQEEKYHNYTLLIPATGKETVERIYKWDHEKLGNLIQGTTLRASLNAKGYVAWTRAPTGESVLSDPNTNYQSVKNERAYSQAEDERKFEQEEKSIAISLQGFAQAFVIGQSTLNAHGEGADVLVDRSIAFAVKAREALLKKAHDIASADAARKLFADDPSL